MRFPSFLICSLLLALPGRGVQSSQLTVVDDLGRSVSLRGPATRVVSLAPSITETLFALGAGGQVIGVTDYCNYPPGAQAKTRVGGMTNPSIETIISLSPDLVVLSMEGNVREDFSRLEALGIPLFVTNPRSLEGIHRSIRDLGILTGRAEQAETLVRGMVAREDSVRSGLSGQKQRVLMFVSVRPLMVAGKNTFLSELIERAGGINLAARSGGTYPAFSRESVVADDPDVLLFTSDVLSDTALLTETFPEWRELRALKHHRVYRIDADIISRPGPRAVDGLMTLFHILHSERQ